MYHIITQAILWENNPDEIVWMLNFSILQLKSNSMKKTTSLLLLLLCSVLFTKAQLFKPSRTSEAFGDSLAIIVQDFKKNFSGIEGRQLPSQGEMDVFHSKATIPGAVHCAIYRFHSLQDTTASFQAIMYEGESYEEAIKVYKNTYKQLKKTRMKWVDKSMISFIGEMEEPDESIRFTTTALRLNIIDRPYRRFFGELELTSNYDGWEVHFSMHNRKNDAERY